MTTPSTPTSTMKEAERLTAMAEKCGATVYRNRASVHSPAVAFGDESWARFCETIVGLVTAAAQARSLVEAQPSAVVGEAPNIAVLNALQILERMGLLHTVSMTAEQFLRRMGEANLWVIDLPALAAPSAVLPLKGEVEAASTLNPACGVHGAIPCEGAGCICNRKAAK